MPGYFKEDGTYVSTSASKVFSEVQASVDAAFKQEEE